MEKRNKIILILIIILTVIVLILCGYLLINRNNLWGDDAKKFRNEYMKLNDQVNSDGAVYPTVVISEDNNVKYLTEKDAVEMLKEGTGLIYFGFNTCPWCRSLIPTLLEVSEKMDETVYYLDIKNIKSTFEIKNGELVTTKKGTKYYYQLLELLDEHLDAYYITDGEGGDYDTYEKRIYSPTLVAVKDGDITGFHTGTVSSQLSGYDELSNAEKEELKNIIIDLINSKNSNY